LRKRTLELGGGSETQRKKRVSGRGRIKENIEKTDLLLNIIPEKRNYKQTDTLSGF